MRLFQTALDLADAREGALFVVVRDPSTFVSMVAPPIASMCRCRRWARQ
jgi:hypothetical protein